MAVGGESIKLAGAAIGAITIAKFAALDHPIDVRHVSLPEFSRAHQYCRRAREVSRRKTGSQSVSNSPALTLVDDGKPDASAAVLRSGSKLVGRLCCTARACAWSIAVAVSAQLPV